jgi:hypothetical protein
MLLELQLITELANLNASKGRDFPTNLDACHDSWRVQFPFTTQLVAGGDAGGARVDSGKALRRAAGRDGDTDAH